MKGIMLLILVQSVLPKVEPFLGSIIIKNFIKTDPLATSLICHFEMQSNHTFRQTENCIQFMLTDDRNVKEAYIFHCSSQLSNQLMFKDCSQCRTLFSRRFGPMQLDLWTALISMIKSLTHHQGPMMEMCISDYLIRPTRALSMTSLLMNHFTCI